MTVLEYSNLAMTPVDLSQSGARTVHGAIWWPIAHAGTSLHTQWFFGVGSHSEQGNYGSDTALKRRFPACLRDERRDHYAENSELVENLLRNPLFNQSAAHQ